MSEKRVSPKLTISLHANGIPPFKLKDARRLVRAAMKLGCSEIQAVSIAKMAYCAAEGFHWDILGSASGLEIHTKLGN